MKSFVVRKQIKLIQNGSYSLNRYVKNNCTFSNCSEETALYEARRVYQWLESGTQDKWTKINESLH